MTRSLLFCYAHPDDESYLAAGTIARYANDGHTHVALVTATRGGAATLGPDAICTREQLPEVRTAELDRAAELLGIRRSYLLDYPDRQLAAADPEEIRRELVSVIRWHRPEVVVTFDPNGHNLHPDHIAISRFTADAVAAAADGRWLPEAGLPHEVQRLLWSTPVAAWTMIRASESAADHAAVPGVDFLIGTRDYIDAKQAALRAHASQRAGIDALLLGGADRDAVLAAETFRLGWGPAPARRPAECLFEGLGTRHSALAARHSTRRRVSSRIGA